MKKEYLFLIFIVVILYLMYLILDYKYKEYKINMNIEYIEKNNEKMKNVISENKDTLEYINTEAYKNKVLKEEQSMKNK
jgi:cell division protein FtsL